MITDKPDIFDRIMSLKIFKWANPFYTKYKEVLMYLLFGGLTTLVSVGVFALFESHFGLNEHISNVISWLTAVLFAFVTNRIWVFPTKTKGFAAFIFQMAKFYGGRLFTLGVEELMLFVFVTKLQINAVLIKLIAQVVVVDDIKGVQNEIAWGHQIRSYVFMPYTLVKDHRTNYESGNVQAVMDGDCMKNISQPK